MCRARDGPVGRVVYSPKQASRRKTTWEKRVELRNCHWRAELLPKLVREAYSTRPATPHQSSKFRHVEYLTLSLWIVAGGLTRRSFPLNCDVVVCPDFSTLVVDGEEYLSSSRQSGPRPVVVAEIHHNLSIFSLSFFYFFLLSFVFSLPLRPLIRSCKAEQLLEFAGTLTRA